ncbi:MAG: aminoglycoside phosphotransferase family protein [Burkholderiaceae bacterium]
MGKRTRDSTGANPTQQAPTDTNLAIPDTFRRQCESIVQELGLGDVTDIQAIKALTGGVSSDIAVVELKHRSICIKCSLDQLRVDAAWFAPVRRNLAEYRWIEFAAGVVPTAVPELLGRSSQSNGFAMAFVDPSQAWNYKNGLLSGQADQGEAAAIGDIIGQIHAASATPDFDSGRFNNAADFYALRLEPYLTYTADQHPQVAPQLKLLARHYDQARLALVHGDLSPKNVLIGANGPIVLDAECASFGDPAFDIAFFSNHLALKSFHIKGAHGKLLQAMQQFFQAYQPHVNWEPIAKMEEKTCALLPALMLARVDGKSPVEYLDTNTRRKVRTVAVEMLSKPVRSIVQLVDRLQSAL